jgi:hypothetical protein
MKKRSLREVSQGDLVSREVLYRINVIKDPLSMPVVYEILFFERSYVEQLWKYRITVWRDKTPELTGWKKVKEGTVSHVGLQVAKGLLLNYLNS